MLKILNNEVTVTTEVPNLEGKYVVPVLDLVSNYKLDNLQYRADFDSDTAVEALSFIDRVWVDALTININDLFINYGYAVLYLVVDPKQRTVVGIDAFGQLIGRGEEAMTAYSVDLNSPYFKTKFGTAYGFDFNSHEPIGRIDQLIRVDSLPDDLDRMFYAKSPFIVANKTLLMKSNLPTLEASTKRHGGRKPNRRKQQSPQSLEAGFYLNSPDSEPKRVTEQVFRLAMGRKFVVESDGTIKKF